MMTYIRVAGNLTCPPMPRILVDCSDFNNAAHVRIQVGVALVGRVGVALVGKVGVVFIWMVRG